ncbi:MAG: M56 family metallopeptidase [Fimbriimonas sp.]
MTRETLALATVQSGALFLAIWAIFRLIPSIPANAKAWIWRLAFLKPLLSLLPFAVVTFYVWVPPKAEPVESPALAAPEAPATVSAATASTFAPPPPTSLPIDPLPALWLLGATGVALYGLRGWVHALRVVRDAEPISDFTLQRALAELRDRAEIRKPIRLLRSEGTESAMLIGGRYPTIVLPRSAVEGASLTDIRLMLAHEIAHIVRRDLAWFGVIWTVQSLFFFNPLVWVAARCARLDHESATDRYASQLAGVPVQTYAAMLVRATVVARPSLVPGSLPMAESYRTIHRRLEAMKHFNSQPSPWRKAAIGALALGTVGLMPIYQVAEAAAPQASPTKKKAPAPPKPATIKKMGTVKDEKTGITYYVAKEGATWVVSTKKNGKLVTVKRVPITKTQRAKKPAAPKTPPPPKVVNRPFGSGVSAQGSAGTAVSGTQGGGASGSGGFRPGGQAAKGGSSTGEGFGQAQGGRGAAGGFGQGGTGQGAFGQGAIGGGGTGQGGSGSGGSGQGGFAVGSGSGGGQASAQGGASGSASGSGQGFITRTVNGKTETIGGGSGRSESHSSESSWSSASGQGTNGRISKRINPTTGTSSFGSINGNAETMNFKFNQYNARLAFQMLFRQVGKECSIEPSLNGTVTAIVWNVSFEEALQTLLRATRGSFRLEDGKYILFANGK